MLAEAEQPRETRLVTASSVLGGFVILLAPSVRGSAVSGTIDVVIVGDLQAERLPGFQDLEVFLFA